MIRVVGLAAALPSAPRLAGGLAKAARLGLTGALVPVSGRGVSAGTLRVAAVATRGGAPAMAGLGPPGPRGGA